MLVQLVPCAGSREAYLQGGCCKLKKRIVEKDHRNTPRCCFFPIVFIHATYCHLWSKDVSGLCRQSQAIGTAYCLELAALLWSLFLDATFERLPWENLFTEICIQAAQTAADMKNARSFVEQRRGSVKIKSRKGYFKGDSVGVLREMSGVHCTSKKMNKLHETFGLDHV